jgi:hypothetical protein
LHHEYEDLDVLMEVAENAGRRTDRTLMTEGLQRERQFGTYAEAVEESKRLRAKGLEFREWGARGKVYGELTPEYDAMKNLGSYIQQSTDAIWRKKTYDEAVAKFGLPVDAFTDAGKLYDLHATRQVPVSDRQAIETFLNGNKTVRDLSEDVGGATLEKGGWEKVVTEAQAVLPKLSPDGQKELARELTSMAKSPGQVLRVIDAVGEPLMPPVRVVKAGSIDPYYAKLGQDGTLVPRKGGLWGDTEVQIPAQIAKMLDGAPRPERSEAFKKFVKAWDGYNNAFKMVTYPFYPSGAVRDAYNNVMQSFLGIGAGAFARPLQAGRVLRGKADDVLRVGGYEFKANEARRLAQDLGVTDPTAASFAQFTGERGAEKAGKLQKARVLRGKVDNASRVQLWLNSMASGMTPEDAAGVVKEFLFDYSELSNFDKNVMRRAMPFYVFPRKAIESYGRAAVKTPGRVANLAKPFRGREDENNMMTSWEGEGFKLRLDRDGQSVTMLNGFDLPVRTLDTLWRGGGTQKFLEGLVSMTGPALKVPYMMATGREPFRGQELGRQDAPALGRLMEHAPKWAQALVGYDKAYDNAGRPKYTVRGDRVQALIEAALVSRIFSTSDRAFREQIREPNTAARLLDFFTGLRFKTLDLDEEQARKMADRKRELESALFKAGQRKQFTRTYKAKER